MRTPLLAGLAVAGILAIFLVGYLIADTDESAGPEEEVTLNAVVEEPARYEGERVTVSGEWEETESFAPEDADQVIVLGDDAGTTLLVVPQLGTAVPELDENSVVRVTGPVRLVERGEAGFPAPGGPLEDGGDGPAPIVAAERVEFVADQDAPILREVDQVTVERLLRDPGAFDEAGLAVTGTATKVGDRGFLLTQDGATIFVSAPAQELEAIEDGARLTVRAEPAFLSGFGSDALERALASDPPTDQPASELDPGEIPVEPGEPYLLLRGVDVRGG
jgi:hypothetical protein